MTDKTDIAVFIKSAMLSCAEAFAMEIAGSLEYDIGRDLTDAEHKQVTDAVSGLLHTAEQLEAERQRADNWSVSFENERLRADKLAAHIETLKGEQVPVAWLNDAHLARGHIEGEAGEEDAGPGMIPVYREKYFPPQKSVISKEKLCDWLEDNFDIDDSQRDAFANCFANHCNCIVKKEN